MNDDLVQRMIDNAGDIGDVLMRDDDATPTLQDFCPLYINDEGVGYCEQNGVCPYKQPENCEDYLIAKARKKGLKVF